jgi:hypothetical protein
MGCELPIPALGGSCLDDHATPRRRPESCVQIDAATAGHASIQQHLSLCARPLPSCFIFISFVCEN